MEFNNGNWVNKQVRGGVNGILVHDSSIYCFGTFDSVGGSIAANKIARYDGTNWHNYPPLDTVAGGGQVYCGAVYKGELYVGGNFVGTGTSGTGMMDIAKLDSSTNQWVSVGGGMHDGFSNVRGMIVYQNKLIVSGGIIYSGGDPGNGIAAWDGTQWSDMGLPFNGSTAVRGSMVEYNGELWVCGGLGGFMGGANEVSAKYDGTQWSTTGITFGTGFPTCYAVHNNDLYIGGVFTVVNGVAANYICKVSTAVGLAVYPSANITLIVSPNPATTQCMVSANDIVDGVLSIYDLTGRQLAQQKFNTTETVDVSKFSNGIYIVEVHDVVGKNLKGKMVKL